MKRFVPSISVPICCLIAFLTWQGCNDPIVGAKCEKNSTPCAAGCYNLDRDAQHCGACGNACPTGEQCLEGVCGTCADGMKECNGSCVNTIVNPSHCGACEQPCPGEMPVCINSVCETNCFDWMTYCSGVCVNLDDNSSHCGACKNQCPKDKPFCLSGECISSCTPYTLCADMCIDTSIDPSHCGDCFHVCSDPTILCNEGQCVSKCGEGKVECAGACIDVLINSQHCGDCGVSCRPDEICVAGSCEDACNEEAGEIFCDNRCVDSQTDPSHCRVCSNKCPKSDVCQDGVCVLDCGQMRWCNSGCKDIATDLQHCGNCDNTCAMKEYCVLGICAEECNPPLTVCGDLCVNTDSSPGHCGDCNEVCESGVCHNKACIEGSAGHLIAIGHDYTESHDALRHIIGNAIFMSSSSPVKVLTYAEYADRAPGGQVEKLNTAIHGEAAAQGRSWQPTETLSTDFIDNNLLDYDLLLVYVQSSATLSQLTDIGEKLQTSLKKFLAIGGIIVFTDAAFAPQKEFGTFSLFQAAGLFSCYGVFDASKATAEIVSPTHVLAKGLGDTYYAVHNSAAFSTNEQAVITRVQDSEAPMVIHKVF